MIKIHVEKYNSAQMGNLLKHYSRNNGQDRNYSNQDIDKSKSHLNYNLAPDRGNEIDFINKRIGEVQHINRKDIVKMCDWVVTLPKDYRGDTREFFEKSYKYLANRYGEENVISCYVHMDERTPHMHFAFIPITRVLDKNTQEPVEKLYAKGVICRTELKEIHPSMERYLSKALNQEIHLLNGATKDYNKTVKELKEETAQRDLERLKAFEEVKDKTLEPAEPVKLGMFVKTEYISFSRHTDMINKLNSTIIEQNRQIKQLEQEVYKVDRKAQEAEENREDEYKERLRLQDKLNDKDYLQRHIKELEKEQRGQEREFEINR